MCLLVMVAGLPVAAQQWPPPLEFRSLRVGLPVSELRGVVRTLGGSLACRPSRDARIGECTGSLRFQPRGPRFSLIVAAVRDSAAVVILTAPVPPDSVAAWVEAIEPFQGRVEPRSRGPQRTWQWVRRRQMLRVIQRRENGRHVATVTLTDGPLLDGLGRETR
ncbi:MAG: hypothetical protein ACRENB_00960 [Gemmatimonadales bacterium]